MKQITAICILMAWAATAGCLAAQINEGKQIPRFNVRSGTGKQLDSRELAGKFIVLFYETKDKSELNRDIKTRLNNLYDTLSPPTKGLVTRLPVVDCTWAFWPFTGIWESQLDKHSRDQGFDIFGDWNGSVRRDFGFAENEIYLLIIDSAGIVRFCRQGKLTEDQEAAAEDLVRTLVAAD